jgi:formylglycine-generating enzyme required for sulfatase activity
MAGNGWQWVQDCYEDKYDREPTDGSAFTFSGCVNHVVRRGSWFNYQEPIRSAYREDYAKDQRRSFVGFRVARTLTP